jgi:ubiquinone/menaquinone biosynthesis C-methylase UbiE
VTDFGSLARSFGGVAAEYESARPGYPPAAVEAVISELALGPEATALDLAAGTGKLTRELEPRFRRVIAVEPLPEMLAVIRRDLPRVEALEGGAEEIPLADGSVDVVFVAQAFHWFANHRALAEIDRVLAPGPGGLALIWNISPWESHATPWWGRFDDVLSRYTEDVQRIRTRTSAEWQPAFEGEQPFAPLRRLDFTHSQLLPRERFPDVLSSRSYVTALEPAERARLFAEIEALFDADDAPIEGEEVRLDYTTELYLTSRR